MRLFIFSNYFPIRLARHLAFWLFYYAGAVLMHTSGEGFRELFHPQIYHEAWVDAITFLPSFLFGVYFSIYYLLPAFRKTRKVFPLLLWCFVVFVISCIAGFYGISIFYKVMPTVGAIAYVMHRCITNLISFTGAAVVIKLMKYYNVEQRTHELLSIERTRNKIQLLKKQMQPEILFYSLRKIYEDIDRGVVYAPDMILKLSDLLSYLLYESDSQHLSLRSELRMMETYLELKQLEHPGQLITDFQVDGNPDGLQVAPGVLLPVLEPVIQRVSGFEGKHALSVCLKIMGLQIHFSLTCRSLSDDAPGKKPYEVFLEELRKRMDSYTLPEAYLWHEPHAWGFIVSLQLLCEPVFAVARAETQEPKYLIYEPT